MVRFPVGKTYTLLLLKKYIYLVEGAGFAVDDDLMSFFMEILAQQPKLKEEGIVTCSTV